MVEVYYNSMQFSHTLQYIEPTFETPFDFYQQLGAYYEKMGYEEISHSRMRRYDILLEFLATVENVSMEEVKRQMTIDLYSRENLKSRPEWMTDQRSWQQEIREYIREHGLPKTTHIEVMGEEILLFDYQKRASLNNNVQWESIEFKRKR